MPDRTVPPIIHDIKGLHLPEPEQFTLDNGIPVYAINMGTQEVLKLEIIFMAGRPYEHKKLAARATVGLLREGTRRHDAAAIAEQFDFYGSSLSFPFQLDTSNIVLYSLVKHLDKVLPLLAELLSEPVFPEEELRNFVMRNQQRLQIDLQKPDIVAYRQITEYIFGKDHPYGYNSYMDTYDALERNDLVTHFNRYYNSRNCLILISGRIDDSTRRLLNEQLGQAIPPGDAAKVLLTTEDQPPRREVVDHPDTLQTAIRVGRRLFNRHHPDYHGMYVLNTVLGGYFGSRLMANIREERGYTYNIYSSIDTMIQDGYFYIGTEVGNEFVEDTLRQIHLEMDVLREELIDAEELEMVRNYLLGSFLTLLDGPFNVSDVIKNLVLESLPVSFFAEGVETVRTLQPEAIRELARRYLDPAGMWEVIVGKFPGKL